MVNKYILGVCTGVLFIFLAFWFPSTRGEEVAEDKSAELLLSLSAFAKKHALSERQMQSMLGELVLNGQQLRKGGVGIVTKDVSAILNEDRNAAVIDGKEWVGKKSAEQEIVITDGHHVLDSLNSVNISNLKILIFTPTEFRYIDLSTNTGGKYARR